MYMYMHGNTVIPFQISIKLHNFAFSLQIVVNGSFWVLLVVWGCGAGIFNALVTLLAQMLCSFGYSDVCTTVT